MDGSMDHSPPTATETSHTEQEPSELWQETLARLQYQMAAETFDRLLRSSRLVEATGDLWRIAVRPHAVDWLTHRLNPLVTRNLCDLAGREIRLEYVADESCPKDRPRPAEESGPKDRPPPAETEPPEDTTRHLNRRPPLQRASPAAEAVDPPPSALESILAFDPNSASGGGFWKMGHYANWFWAAYLGTVAWRVYELVISGDRRPQKTRWTPPRRY